MLSPGAPVLQPSSLHADPARHVEQFGCAIGGHVAHDHAPVASLHIVYIDQPVTSSGRSSSLSRWNLWEDDRLRKHRGHPRGDRELPLAFHQHLVLRYAFGYHLL